MYVCPDTAKHQSKPQDIALRSDIALQENNTYLLQSADKKVGEASDINKGFVFRDIYWLYPATRAISDI